MSRNVFFSFDYDDVMAVNVVRNSNVVRGPAKHLPFADYSLYEKVKNTPAAIKRAIDDAIVNTSVAIVLNGQSTWSSKWVRYEIAKSFAKGSGFVVVDIAGVGPRPELTSGPNPLEFMGGVAKTLQTDTDIDIYEKADGKWVAFDMLPRISNAEAKYPMNLVSGNFNLAQRFGRKTTWQSISAFFDSTVEAAARDAGWPQAT